MDAMVLEAQDLVWLLLPVAFVSGWYVARLDQRRTHTAPLPPDYFRGVNYLLNEQPDKAIETFTRMLEVNTETVETHLALGSLFRRRGEVERAIRIHQNLIARPTLDNIQRSEALSELAQDYLKAGLLDRAETLFLELAEIPVYAEQALRSLMSIYEQEKDWDKAIAAGHRLAQTAGQELEPVLAQYYCELGEAALHAGDAILAHERATQALDIDARCARANFLLGNIAVARGNERAAITVWQKIEKQDAALLDEVIDDIVAAFRRLHEESELRTYLQEVSGRQPGMRTLLVLSELIRIEEGRMAAQVFIAEHLRQQPSIPGLKCLMDLQIAQDAMASPMTLDLIKGVLDLISAQQEGYQCRQCGFRGQVLHWQCPACHEWNTVQVAACAMSPKPTAKSTAPILDGHRS